MKPYHWIKYVGLAVIIALMVSACGAATAPEPAPVQEEEPATEARVAEEEPEAEATVEEEQVEAETAKSTTSKNFTVSWVSTDVTSFDPHVCVTTDCLAFMRVVYEALVGFKYGTTEIEGQLAEAWEVSDDGLEWTFTLREGLNFADGSPLTPEDVVYSFDRLNGMQKGAAIYLGGVYKGAEVVDDRTVTVTVEKPLGPFLSMLPRVFIVNSKVVKEHATEDDPWAEEWMYDHDAGSGPFVFEEWEHGVKLSVVKNPNYWDPERPRDVERFTVLYIAERATDQLLLENGEIDALGFPVVDLLPTFETNPDITIEKYESFKGMNLMMSMVVPPLDDVRVRKALSLAFDYQALIDGVFHGLAVQAQGPIPINMKYHDDTLPIYTQDLEQASALLAEAGYPPDSPERNNLELEMLVITGYTPWVGTAQIFQQNLAEIGVKLKIVEMPWSQIAARGANPDNPIQLMAINSFPAYPDPDAVLWPVYHTSQQVVGWNRQFYGDEETDALLDTARFSLDEKEREEAYKALQQRIFEDHAHIWLVNETALSVRRNWVKEFKYDPTWHETYRPDLYLLEGK